MLTGMAAIFASFGGGVLGAAFGALPAFIFTGFLVLAGVTVLAAGGGNEVLVYVAFGPVFGPHVAFAGGVAAAAYAAKHNGFANGRDITQALAGLDRPDVLLMGGLFGLGGHALNMLFVKAGMAQWTDTIALTVVLSAVAARLLFGKTGLLGKPPEAGQTRFQPGGEAVWLPWQQRLAQVVPLSLGMGFVSAYCALLLGAQAGGDVIGFGIAAFLILFLQAGLKSPVMHHIALPAGIAALMSSSVLVGCFAGIVGGLAGEFFSRLFLIRGDTHIDPPAAAIAATVLLLRIADAGGLMAALALP